MGLAVFDEVLVEMIVGSRVGSDGDVVGDEDPKIDGELVDVSVGSGVGGPVAIGLIIQDSHSDIWCYDIDIYV